MISWLKQFIRSLAPRPPAVKTSADAARARVGVSRPKAAGAAQNNVVRMPLPLVEEGRRMLRIKAANPNMTDVELAKQVGRSLDYVYKAMTEARNSYIHSGPIRNAPLK